MEIEIIPAVDIKDGKCVRLEQGDFDKEKVYGENPVKMSGYWENQGARRLHVVDLDGAKTGKPVNLDLINRIAASLKIPLQLGGGVRSLKIIEQYIKNGVDRVIIGTMALKNPEMVKKAVEKFGSDKIVVGVDARKGKVAVEGWLEESEKEVSEVVKSLKNKGVKTFIYTDIGKDGMLIGPDVEGMKRLLKIKGVNIIASGGISSQKDLEKLSKIGVKQAIVGKALYDNKLDHDILKRD